MLVAIPHQRGMVVAAVVQTTATPAREEPLVQAEILVQMATMDRAQLVVIQEVLAQTVMLVMLERMVTQTLVVPVDQETRVDQETQGVLEQQTTQT